MKAFEKLIDVVQFFEGFYHLQNENVLHEDEVKSLKSSIRKLSSYGPSPIKRKVISFEDYCTFLSTTACDIFDSEYRFIKFYERITDYACRAMRIHANL